MSRHQRFSLQRLINKASVGLLNDMVAQCHADMENEYVEGFVKTNCSEIIEMVTFEMHLRAA